MSEEAKECISNYDISSKPYIHDKYDVNVETVKGLVGRYESLFANKDQAKKAKNAKEVMANRFSVARCLIDTLYQYATEDIGINNKKYELMYDVGKKELDKELESNRVSKLFVCAEECKVDSHIGGLNTGSAGSVPNVFYGPVWKKPNGSPAIKPVVTPIVVVNPVVKNTPSAGDISVRNEIVAKLGEIHELTKEVDIYKTRHKTLQFNIPDKFSTKFVNPKDEGSVFIKKCYNTCIALPAEVSQDELKSFTEMLERLIVKS